MEGHTQPTAPAQPTRTVEVRPEIDSSQGRLRVRGGNGVYIATYETEAQRAEVEANLSVMDRAEKRFEASAEAIRSAAAQVVASILVPVVCGPTITLYAFERSDGALKALSTSPERVRDLVVSDHVDSFHGIADDGCTLDHNLRRVLEDAVIRPVLYPKTMAGLHLAMTTAAELHHDIEHELSEAFDIEHDVADELYHGPKAEDPTPSITFGFDSDGIAVVVGDSWTTLTADAMHEEIEPITSRTVAIAAGAESAADLGVTDCTVRVAVVVAEMLAIFEATKGSREFAVGVVGRAAGGAA